MTAMIVFHNQLEAVERPTPRERIGRGKISPAHMEHEPKLRHGDFEMKGNNKIKIGHAPITTQAPGPQVDAKKKM